MQCVRQISWYENSLYAVEFPQYDRRTNSQCQDGYSTRTCQCVGKSFNGKDRMLWPSFQPVNFWSVRCRRRRETRRYQTRLRCHSCPTFDVALLDRETAVLEIISKNSLRLWNLVSFYICPCPAIPHLSRIHLSEFLPLLIWSASFRLEVYFILREKLTRRALTGFRVSRFYLGLAVL